MDFIKEVHMCIKSERDPHTQTDCVVFEFFIKKYWSLADATEALEVTLSLQ